METLQALIESGRLIDAIFALMALEAAALAINRARTGQGPTLIQTLSNLAAGGFILLALRTALTGGDWRMIAGCLVASLIAHIADVTLRWPRA